MTAEKPFTVREFAKILKGYQDYRIHLQTSPEAELYVQEFMKWLTGTYTVRYCRADTKTFKPHCLHKERTVRSTPENIRKLQPSSSPHFVRRIETAPVYGYLNEKGKLVAMSGVAFLTKKSAILRFHEFARLKYKYKPKRSKYSLGIKSSSEFPLHILKEMLEHKQPLSFIIETSLFVYEYEQ